MREKLVISEMLFTFYAGILHGLAPFPTKIKQEFCTLLLPDGVKVARANKNGAGQTTRQEQLLHKRYIEKPVLRIRRIRKFLGLLDPDRSITSKNSKKNLNSFVTTL
jgi:hypothetical protein